VVGGFYGPEYVCAADVGDQNQAADDDEGGEGHEDELIGSGHSSGLVSPLGRWKAWQAGTLCRLRFHSVWFSG